MTKLRTPLTVAASMLLPILLAVAPTAAATVDVQALLQKNRCLMCHSLDGKGGKMGGTLEQMHTQGDAAKIAAYIRNPKAVNPRSMMPVSKLSDEELNALTDYIMGLGK